MENPNNPVPDPALPPVPSAAQPAQAPIQDSPQIAAPPSSPASQPATPAQADDGDLIEKEWVTQVKQVVAKTAHDPYEQNRLFSKLKADYMQKRYGKIIKSDD